MNTSLAPFSALSSLPSAERVFALEAGDRVGKTTCITNLVPYLAQRGWHPQVFREPGGTPMAERIRAALKGPLAGAPDAEKVRLFFAARKDLIEHGLRPFLAADPRNVVLLDRFFWSTIVYQGVLGGVSLEDILALVQTTCATMMPDQTFVLDLDPHIVHERVVAAGGHDAYDWLTIEDKGKLRQGYLDLATLLPGMLSVIDADQSPDALVETVGERILARLAMTSDRVA